MNQAYPQNISGIGAGRGGSSGQLAQGNGERAVMTALKALTETIDAQEKLLGDLSERLDGVLKPVLPEPVNRIAEATDPTPAQLSSLALAIMHELNRAGSNNGVLQNLLSRLEI